MQKPEVAISAIHCKPGVISHPAYLLNIESHITAIISTTFFQNVAQLDMMNASPKQPQSATGLAIAIQRVRGSMKHINAVAPQATVRRNVPKHSITPMMNSTAQRANAPTFTKLGHNSRFITAR